MNDVETFVRCSKKLLDLYRSLAATLPKGQVHEDAEKHLGEAEKAFRASEEQLAKSLDYLKPNEREWEFNRLRIDPIMAAINEP
jgi:hypothetical protein